MTKVAARATLLILAIAASASPCRAQQLASFPFNDTSVASPDGRFALEMKRCTNPDRCDRRLWLVDRESGSRRLFVAFSRDVQAAWAPEGRTIFWNDNEASNSASAYVYSIGGAKRIDLGRLIDRSFPEDRRFEKESHHYVNGEAWLSAHVLLVRRFGHFGNGVPGREGFSVCYKVDTDGKVARRKAYKEETKGCKE